MNPQKQSQPDYARKLYEEQNARQKRQDQIDRETAMGVIWFFRAVIAFVVVGSILVLLKVFLIDP